MNHFKQYILIIVALTICTVSFKNICMELTPEMRYQIDKGKEKESSSSSSSESKEIPEFTPEEQEQMEIAKGKEKDKPKKPNWVKRTKTAVRNVFSRKKQIESSALTLPEDIQLHILLQL